MTSVDTTCDPDRWLDQLESVGGGPVRFNVKLYVGQDAYKLLRLRTEAYEV